MSDALVAPKKPTLLKIGARTLSTKGFRHDLLEEHLTEHLGKPQSQHWCAISCLTRTFYGRDTKKGREAIRHRLPRAFRTLLDRGLFMAIEFAEHGHGHHGEALAVKLSAGKTELESQHIAQQLTRMKRRLHLSHEQVKKACKILQLPLPLEE